MDATTESLIAAVSYGLSFDEAMDQPVKRNASYLDLEGLPRGTRAELIDGDLWTFASPTPQHQLVVGELRTRLDPVIRRPDGWIILMSVDIRFGPRSVLVPDLAGWRRSRMARVPDDAKYIELPPDWLCEVLSPSTSRFDKGRKREIYATAGVETVWFVDPRTRAIEVNVLDGKSYRFVSYAEATEKVALAPFHDIELDLRRLWES